MKLTVPSMRERRLYTVLQVKQIDRKTKQAWRSKKVKTGSNGNYGRSASKEKSTEFQIVIPCSANFLKREMDGKEKELKENIKYFQHYIPILTMESEVPSADQTHTQILNIKMWGLWCALSLIVRLQTFQYPTQVTSSLMQQNIKPENLFSMYSTDSTLHADIPRADFPTSSFQMRGFQWLFIQFAQVCQNKGT